MTPMQMSIAGSKYSKSSFTDAELDEQIESLELVLAYFQGRGELLTSRALRQDLEMFKTYKEAR